jgi:hypothetical protein
MTVFVSLVTAEGTRAMGAALRGPQKPATMTAAADIVNIIRRILSSDDPPYADYALCVAHVRLWPKADIS